MYNNQPIIKQKNIILILLQSIFLAVTIITSYNILTAQPPTPKISINNIDDYLKEASDEDLQNIYSQIYIMAAKNSAPSINLPNSGATIKKDSFNSEITGDNSYYSFIVDLPFIKKSFLVQYTKAKDNSQNSGYPILVSCPPEDKRIYSENCTSNY